MEIYTPTIAYPLPGNLSILFIVTGVQASWDEWWTYDGISGKSYAQIIIIIIVNVSCFSGNKKKKNMVYFRGEFDPSPPTLLLPLEFTVSLRTPERTTDKCLFIVYEHAVIVALRLISYAFPLSFYTKRCECTRALGTSCDFYIYIYTRSIRFFCEL